jgi:hypothetical protein
MILIGINERTLFIKENKKEMRPAWLTKSIAVFVFIIKTWNGKKKKWFLCFKYYSPFKLALIDMCILLNGYWLLIKWVVQVYLVL